MSKTKKKLIKGAKKDKKDKKAKQAKQPKQKVKEPKEKSSKKPKVSTKKKKKKIFKSKNPNINIHVGQENPWLSMVISGAANAGKTVLAGQSADVKEMGYILYASVERGSSSMRASKTIKHLDKIIVYSTPTLNELRTIHEFMLKHVYLRDKYLKKPNKYNRKKIKKLNKAFGFPEHIIFYTFILDSITRLEDRLIRDISANEASSYRKKYLTSNKKDSKLLKTDYTPLEMTHYGVNTALLNGIIDKLINMPLHVILITGIKPEYRKLTEEDKASGLKQPEIIGQVPAMTGQVASTISHQPQVVGFLVKKEVEIRGSIKIARVLLLNDTENFYKCKSRITAEDTPELVKPTMKQIFKYHKESIKANKNT